MPQDVQVLFEDIGRRVKDSYYDAGVICPFVNRALFALASALRPQRLTRIFVPFQTVAGGAPTPLPDDLLFPHILSVFDESDNPLFFSTRLTDVDHILKKNRQALLFAMDGAYFFPIQGRGALLRLTYVSTPQVVDEDDDETVALDFLPEPYGRQAVIAHVCKEIYKEIEDGIDGAMVNTDKHEADYIRAIASIQEIIGQSNLARRPERITGDPFARGGSLLTWSL